ncbi:nitroreductase family protein [Hornefia butyriciproducens]|uniref:nitroreductase family protein n=1 Tax=Hornefia butyriciproducens TaxID=2652293 RepID=UPI003F899B3E
MNVIELMKQRRSCRAFLDKQIPEDTLQMLLDASISAPSSGGFQNYSIIKIQDCETKQKLKECCMGQSFIEQAAVNLIFCIDLHRERLIADAIHALSDTNLDYTKLILLTIDASAAAQTFCIAAESLGLRTVYIGNILNQQKKVVKLLGFPEMVVPIIMVCCGYPAVTGSVSEKYPREILIHDSHYEDKPVHSLLEAFQEKYQRWKMKPNDKLLQKIGETAELHFGQEFREINYNTMVDNNYVDPLSFWYGYYYSQTEKKMSQEEHLSFLQEQKLPFIEKRNCDSRNAQKK